MINATKLLQNTSGFSPVLFTNHLREPVLLAAGHHQTKQGWFNKKGQFLGANDVDAIKSTALQYTKEEANQFYIVSSDEAESIQLGKVIPIHGVLIWGFQSDAQLDQGEEV